MVGNLYSSWINMWRRSDENRLRREVVLAGLVVGLLLDELPSKSESVAILIHAFLRRVTLLLINSCRTSLHLIHLHHPIGSLIPRTICHLGMSIYKCSIDILLLSNIAAQLDFFNLVVSHNIAI
jgi:hypothetical protein